jgi:hypothetical protein
MAQYQVGRSTYELPDDLDSATLNATLQQLAEQEAIRPRDNAFGYSVDQAQRLGGRAVQQVGTAIGSDALTQAGQNIVAEQERDIQQGGYQTGIQDANTIEAIRNGRGFSHVGTLMAENGAGTLATLGLGAAAAIAGVFSLPVTALALGGAALAAGVGLGIGETAETAEQAGLDINNPNTARANVGIGAIVGLMDRIGAGKAIPKDQLAKMTIGEVADELVKQGKTGAAKKFLKESAKGFAVEGTTEAAQSAIMTGGVAAQGGQITSDQVINDLVDSFAVGGATGAGVRGGISGVASAADAVSKSGRIDVRDPQAAADLAKRLEAIVEANDFDLNDIDKMSTTGARATVDMAHIQLTEELKAMFNRAKDKLTPTDADNLQTLSDKILAIAAQREGRSKTKSLVGQQEMDAVDRLIGEYQEGADAMSILRQLNELTTVHNSGYQGGISQYTDQLSPFGSKVGYDKSQIATEALLRPLATGGLALQTGGTSLGLQLGAVGTGRAIDSLTGRRSRVRRYIEQNAGQTGQTQQDLPSLAGQREASRLQEEADAAAAAERSRMLARIADERGDPFHPESPLGIAARELGTEDRQVVYAALDAVEQDTPEFAEEIALARQSGQEGDTRIPNLSLLIGRMKKVTGMSSAPQGLSPLQQAQAATGLYQQTENYKRGVADNQRALQEAIDAVNNDASLSPADKAILVTGLTDMGKNLGANPVEAVQAKAQDIVGRSADKEAAQKYVMPYVERVLGQQNAKKQLSDLVDTIQEEQQDLSEVSFMGDPDAPMLQQAMDPFGIGDLINLTNLGIRPTPEQIAAMRDGTYKPEKKRKKEAAAQLLQDRWQEATGRNAPFAYFDENIDLIASLMATEAMQNLREDTNAIGWYDRKLKAAKAIVSLVDPRVTETYDNEAAFDFALAVTSNGQAVADNFEMALEVFRGFMDNGVMPENWNKGGDRANAMNDAFRFFNAYNRSKQNLSIADFLDTDFTVRQLRDWVAGFNEQNGTDLSLPSNEGVDVEVKGSYILGAKIGQGFYQNLRGNFDPLTMDLWWMRMWNRLIGSPYEKDKNLDNSRVIALDLIPKATGVTKKLVNETLKQRGEKRSDLRNDFDRLDSFLVDLDKAFQRYYKKYVAENGSKPDKPQLLKTAGTHAKNLKPQLQAQPRNATERQYMRDVVAAARAKLASVGVDINTADFQALMWYPEKQLFRHLGVAPGRGSDNDYQDAAVLLAAKEGISNDQIQEALAAAEAGGTVAGRADTGRQAGRGSPQLATDGASQEGILAGQQEVSDFSQSDSIPLLADAIETTKEAVGDRDLPIRAPTPTEVADQLPRVKAMFEIGKEGGDFEQGLNAEDAKEIGRALGYLIVDTKNKADMDRFRGDGRKTKSDQFNAGVNIEMSRMSVPNRIGVVQAGYVNPKDPEYQSVSSIEYLHTMLHEAVGHAIEKRPTTITYDPILDEAGNRLDPRENRRYMNVTFERDGVLVTEDNVEAVANPVYPEGQLFNKGIPVVPSPVGMGYEPGRRDTVRGMFAEAIKAGDKTNFDPDKAVDDLTRYQKSIVASSRNPEIGQMQVRSTYGHADAALARGQNRAQIKEFLLKIERTNFHKIAELLADGVAGYAINPTAFKDAYPEAAKMIRFYFNAPSNPTSKTVQFYAHPLPTVLAVMLAMIAAAGSGGEEEQPQGVLTPQSGALSI